MDYATIEGTESYQLLKNIDDYHFRKSDYTANLTLSSLGMGTYLGNIDAKTDILVEEAIKESLLSGGVNIIDTAINYRYQKAERSIGKALNDLFSQNLLKREQIFISTKNGYVPGDGDRKVDPRSYLRNLLADPAIDKTSFVDNNNSIHPSFLESQLDQSLENLDLKTIDLLYLHNTAEAHIPHIGLNEYLNRLQSAFSFLEDQRHEGKIQFFGLATWNCFRTAPSSKKDYLNLEDVVTVAEEVGGKHHGFKFVQLPINLLMNESFTKKWQTIDNNKVSFLNAADHLKIGVFGSVPLLQTKLFQGKVPNFSGLSSKSQKLLQFVRSLPYKSVIAPLVGHKSPEHVSENLEIMIEPPVDKESFDSFLREIPNIKL